MVRSGSIKSMAAVCLKNNFDEAAGSDDGHRRAVFFLNPLYETFDEADIAPEKTGLHRGLRVLADHGLRALTATRGSMAAALCSASAERLAPGAMTPPS